MLGAALVLAAASAVLAAPVPAQESSVKSTHNATAYYYYQNGRAGACGSYSQDSELVVGLPAEFFPAPFVTPSSHCGEYVVVQGVNKNITARVADASTLNETMTFSIGAWDALNATETDLTTVSWRFANETEAAAAAKTAESQPSTTVAAPSSTRSIDPKKPSASASITSSWVAPSSSSAAASSSSAAYTTTTTSAWVAPSSSAEASSSSTTSTWVAPSSSAKASSSWAPASSSSSSEWKESSSSAAPSSSWAAETTTSEWTAPSSSSSSEWVAPTTTTTSEWVAPTTTTTTSQWTAPTTTQAAETKAAVSNANSGSYSGRATFYTQGGVAGSCGSVAIDGDYVVALSYSQVDGGAHCGRTVSITNTDNGRSITARVADTCPGCGYGSLDLSTGAFGAIGSYDQGVLPISWSFTS
ncbi:hypothetical protein JCM8115_005306 [Rhodotorula mucilaginosa]